MFDDIELTIGEVLPSGSIEAGANTVAGTYATCTDVCTCGTLCCNRNPGCGL